MPGSGGTLGATGREHVGPTTERQRREWLSTTAETDPLTAAEGEPPGVVSWWAAEVSVLEAVGVALEGDDFGVVEAVYHRGGDGVVAEDLAPASERLVADARVEDRIRQAQDAGLGRLPSKLFAINQVWLELALTAADLLAWTRTILLAGEPERLARGCGAGSRRP